MKTLISIILIFGLFHFAFLAKQKRQLNKIIKEFEYSNKERDDSWDWLVQAFENVEMCTTPIIISCETRGLCDEDEE